MRKGKGYTDLKKAGYGDPNRPTRASDYGKTGEYSAAYKKEFHPGRTARYGKGNGRKKGNGTPLSSMLPKPDANFSGAFRNIAADSPRKGQAFNVVHRNGVRYHKYADGRLIPDKQAGSSKRVKRSQS